MLPSTSSSSSTSKRIKLTQKLLAASSASQSDLVRIVDVLKDEDVISDDFTLTFNDVQGAFADQVRIIPLLILLGTSDLQAEVASKSREGI